MRTVWLTALFLITGAAVLVHGLSENAHEFLQSECAMCHVDLKNAPGHISSFVTAACENCHGGIKEKQSHPTDVNATMPVPQDMPLTDGRLTCITCHYVHPKKGKQLIKRHYFLRRNVQGPLFCSICHEINEKGHIVVAEIHPGSFKVTDRQGSIDKMSLGCIECHDTHYKDRMELAGAGTWKHFSEMTHPIGITYKDVQAKKMNHFRHESALRKEITLFQGKIGCGTCHSIYSHNRAKLVIDNFRSRLCRECHLK